jgi:hypothetical protein
MSRRFWKLIGLDRAILFTIGSRGWQTAAGAITMLLIARNLRPVEQGYYYTFSSLVAIQLIFELGFSFVVLQTAAHERTKLTALSNDEISGDPVALARISSLLKRSIRWYAVAAVALVAALTATGVCFFDSNQQGGTPIHWKGPWSCVLCATFLTFQMDPVVSFLEGCGHVVNVAKLRLCQAILGSSLSWLCMAFHHGLYSPGAMIGGQALGSAYFLLQVNRRMLLRLLKVDTRIHSIRWKTEILPFQWRIAVSWASIYITFQLLNPILFAYRGAIEAGKMGMSLSVCSALAGIAVSWMSTKAAPMGMLVAQNKIVELNQVFRKTVAQSSAFLLVASVVVLGGLWIVSRYAPKYAARVLPIPSFALLVLAIVLGHIVQCEAYYLRAHKREPFLWFWVLIAFITIVAITTAAKFGGMFSVALAYLLCAGVLRLSAGTYVFLSKRREWHVGLLVNAEVE